MNRTVRPNQIVEILRGINADYPTDMAASLEAYISDLEAHQQVKSSNRGVSSQNTESRYWHAVRRERERREQALRKQNNYK